MIPALIVVLSVLCNGWFWWLLRQDDPNLVLRVPQVLDVPSFTTDWKGLV